MTLKVAGGRYGLCLGLELRCWRFEFRLWHYYGTVCVGNARSHDRTAQVHGESVPSSESRGHSMDDPRRKAGGSRVYGADLARQYACLYCVFITDKITIFFFFQKKKNIFENKLLQTAADARRRPSRSGVFRRPKINLWLIKNTVQGCYPGFCGITDLTRTVYPLRKLPIKDSAAIKKYQANVSSQVQDDKWLAVCLSLSIFRV